MLNYTETTFGGQRAVMKLVASGALDRHPGLKILISEGGATWVPFIADRMEEGYRQHAMAVRPKLRRSPGEIIYRRSTPRFQHDQSAVAAATNGLQERHVGQRLPAHGGHVRTHPGDSAWLFDGVDPAIRERVTVGAFSELFPGMPPLPRPGWRGMSDDTCTTHRPSSCTRWPCRNVRRPVGHPGCRGHVPVACSCQLWETTAATREDGLNLARRHTGSIQ